MSTGKKNFTELFLYLYCKHGIAGHYGDETMLKLITSSEGTPVMRLPEAMCMIADLKSVLINELINDTFSWKNKDSWTGQGFRMVCLQTRDVGQLIDYYWRLLGVEGRRIF
jgi:hypothetical protein